MTFVKILSLALLLIFIGGFGYFAVTDIPIHQTEKTETFTADHFKK